MLPPCTVAHGAHNEGWEVGFRVGALALRGEANLLHEGGLALAVARWLISGGVQWVVLGPVERLVPVEGVRHANARWRRIADWELWREDCDGDFIYDWGGCAGLSAGRKPADGFSIGHDGNCGVMC